MVPSVSWILYTRENVVLSLVSSFVEWQTFQNVQHQAWLYSYFSEIAEVTKPIGINPRRLSGRRKKRPWKLRRREKVFILYGIYPHLTYYRFSFFTPFTDCLTSWECKVSEARPVFPVLEQFLINCQHSSICGMNETTEVRWDLFLY